MSLDIIAFKSSILSISDFTSTKPLPEIFSKL
nr:MAG TPA: hypothetical protein [Caudoviricetes sp.]